MFDGRRMITLTVEPEEAFLDICAMTFHLYRWGFRVRRDRSGDWRRR